VTTAHHGPRAHTFLDEALLMIAGQDRLRVEAELDRLAARFNPDPKVIATKYRHDYPNGLTPGTAERLARAIVSPMMLRDRYRLLKSKINGGPDPAETEWPSAGAWLAEVMHEIAGPSGVEALAAYQSQLAGRLVAELAEVETQIEQSARRVDDVPGRPAWTAQAPGSGLAPWASAIDGRMFRIAEKLAKRADLKARLERLKAAMGFDDAEGYDATAATRAHTAAALEAAGGAEMLQRAALSVPGVVELAEKAKAGDHIARERLVAAARDKPAAFPPGFSGMLEVPPPPAGEVFEPLIEELLRTMSPGQYPGAAAG
jgi:hypothetical protein